MQTTIAAPVSTEPDLKTESAPRLDFLDGLRGLAALYVVLFHAWGELAWSKDCCALSSSVWWKPITYGRYAVVLFIAISGYSLMIPVLREPNNRLKGGLSLFLKHRLFRIIPTYYTCLALSLVAIFKVPGMNVIDGMRWDSCLPVDAAAIGSHLLLLHNLNDAWIYKIVNPAWSLSTEWEIYFVFALLLLPLWRKAGSAWTLCTSVALGLGVYIATSSYMKCACPWLVFIFTLGMVASELKFSTDKRKRHLERTLPVLALGLTAATLWILDVELAPIYAPKLQFGFVSDSLFGIACFSLLVHCAKSAEGALSRFLSTNVCRFLGMISYSLYLVHDIIMGVLHQALRLVKATPVEIGLATFLVGIPASILAAWLLAHYVEAPYFRWRKQTRASSSLSKSVAAANA